MDDLLLTEKVMEALIRKDERERIGTDLINRADVGLEALPKVFPSEWWIGYWQGRKEAGETLKQ